MTGSLGVAPQAPASLGPGTLTGVRHRDPSCRSAGSLVELDAVTHRFGEVTALDRLTLAVPREQITVLLGPNGAGKTTAIRVITGALTPTEGTVSTFGLDPRADGAQVRSRCGVVSAKPALYDRLSGYDNLLYSARLYEVDPQLIEPRIREAAQRFAIEYALGQQVGGYSTGMKTRLALARSVLHRPELLLFDEPTSGLDPESSQAVLDLIRDMTSDGRTVVMCTHLLAEAEGLADHVVVLDQGTDLIAGSPSALTRRYWPGAVVRLEAEHPERLDTIASWDGVIDYVRGDIATVTLDDISRVPDMIRHLVEEEVRLRRVEPHVPTLEDLYFAVRREASP
ncbi:MAG: ABC transporter ATP-binding protein [Actinobacteria bacterium]|nr:MAG: ABC transporter ATP-binding protein [Actinomycetota bacterium]RIK05649.1 MAG: ABC transporter ATP-binding protein [Acidobacteriota bacterium]